MSATKTREQAVEPPQPQTITIAPLDEITRYVHANSGVDLDTMPSTFEETGRYALPMVDSDKTQTVDLGNGRTKEVPADIGHLNRDKFVYAWLNEETAHLPRFSGYRTVTPDCPAAYADGKPIPATYFGGKSYIRVGSGDILHFAKVTFAQAVKKTTQDRALQRLRGFQPGERSVDVADDDSGKRAGGVVTRNFEHAGFQED